MKLVRSEASGASLPPEIPVSQPAPTASSLRRIYERPSTTCSKPKRVSPSSDEEPSASLHPHPPSSLQVVKGSSPTEVGDEDAMGQIRKGHDTMCMVLTSRMRNLDTVRVVWSSGDIKTSLDSAVAVNDLSVVVDMLNIINQKASLWKLDLCLTVLPQIDRLLQSKYESYVQTGCVSLKLVLQRFLPLITDTLAAPPSVGVDISREERLAKCKMCYKHLRSLWSLVKSRASQSGRYGSAFRELHLLMCALD
ncbi:PREDICTED: katanin p80 WD40 repeat-containing subunit B1-like [Nanorana parkeri]|uniref:katanin p80 WD40 repeat-containing subunit B1-like n=1 Tax=Nanorana parkeri TaxID=125878 RepID=UPI000854D149|nr:PREDICTED: katanin p80 WD40 repeat-containing subunit B1-like [Nanorana parkeri]